MIENNSDTSDNDKLLLSNLFGFCWCKVNYSIGKNRGYGCAKVAKSILGPQYKMGFSAAGVFFDMSSSLTGFEITSGSCHTYIGYGTSYPLYISPAMRLSYWILTIVAFELTGVNIDGKCVGLVRRTCPTLPRLRLPTFALFWCTCRVRPHQGNAVKARRNAAVVPIELRWVPHKATSTIIEPLLQIRRLLDFYWPHFCTFCPGIFADHFASTFAWFS